MAKKEKGKNIVPQEYVDKMQEFDVEAWRKQKIADALRNHEERHPEFGADLPPAWMNKNIAYNENGYAYVSGGDPFVEWLNCISTATSPYCGMEGRVIGNKSFVNPKSADYYEKKGFRKLNDDEQLQHGDLVQVYDGHSNSPTHMLTYTGDDDNGNRLYSYGRGFDNLYKRNGQFPLYDEDYLVGYRFVGTPEDIAEIEAHNSMVREYNKKTAPLREKREVPLLETEPLDNKKMTADWLKTLPKRK